LISNRLLFAALKKLQDAFADLLPIILVMLTNRSSDEVHVYEIMTKPVIMVPADMDVKYVARLLHRADIRRAPVKDQGKLIGMISLSSLILDNDLL